LDALGWWIVPALLLMALAYCALLLSGDTVDALVEEDGVFETAGTVGLGAAAVGFGVGAVRARRAAAEGRVSSLKVWVLALFALGMFVAAGEEISWGQRIFGIETPESIREDNVQGELNLHNLSGVQGKMDIAFQLFWGMFIVLAVAEWVSPRRGAWVNRFLPVAPLGVAVFLAANYVMAQIAERAFEGGYTSIYPLIHSVTELKEAVAGIGLGIAAWLAHRGD
jgi:hypothetical protein